MNEQFLAAICSGAVFVAIIETLRALGGWILNRWAKKKDRQEEKEEKNIDEHLIEIDDAMSKLKEEIQGLKDTLKIQLETNQYILHDRLRYLAKCFITEGEISYEDREMWNGMHKCYKDNNGDGWMDTNKDTINSLPLKKG